MDGERDGLGADLARFLGSEPDIYPAYSSVVLVDHPVFAEQFAVREAFLQDFLVSGDFEFFRLGDLEIGPGNATFERSLGLRFVDSGCGPARDSPELTAAHRKQGQQGREKMSHFAPGAGLL